MTTKKNETQSDKEFNPSVGLWTAKNGNGFTVNISESVLATISKAELGGRLFFREVPQDLRERYPDMPVARLVIFPPGEKPTAKQEETTEGL